MTKLILTYIEQALRIEQLERELAEAQGEIVRLKGEAESWEKVFDRTCQLLADAKTALAEPAIKESLTPQRQWVGLTDEEITQGNRESLVDLQAWKEAVRWAESKLREKNT